MRATLTRLASFAGAAAIFCGLSTAANAQFHAVYGGEAEDAAQGGIIETNEGEFITIGHSSSFGVDQDVYIVKTDRCGRLIWARTYDLGGSDVGRKIRQTEDGGFITVGSTENRWNCCTYNDAFLMKINREGDPEWTRTLGGSNDDQGADVRARGDVYYFAGRTNSYGRGDYDGWLGAVRSDGTLLWSRVYGSEREDGFNSLDLGCSENIIGVGGTRGYTEGGDLDVWVVKTRIDGTGPDARHYGGRRDDEAWSVTAYRENNFYVAGYTESLGNGREGYILDVDCESLRRRVDVAYGGIEGEGDDEFTEIQVNQFNGNLTLSGFMHEPPGGLGGYDVWLHEVDPGLGFVLSRVYGDRRHDQGWSVVVTRGIYDEYDYLLAGYTDSYGVFGGRDLYIIRADQNGKSGCQESEPKLNERRPEFDGQDAETWWPLVLKICDARPELRKNDRYKYICFSCEGGRNVPGAEELSLRDNRDADQARMLSVAARPQVTK